MYYLLILYIYIYYIQRVNNICKNIYIGIIEIYSECYNLIVKIFN